MRALRVAVSVRTRARQSYAFGALRGGPITPTTRPADAAGETNDFTEQQLAEAARPIFPATQPAELARRENIDALQGATRGAQVSAPDTVVLQAQQDKALALTQNAPAASDGPFNCVIVLEDGEAPSTQPGTQPTTQPAN